jgi:hypothetical protein
MATTDTEPRHHDSPASAARPRTEGTPQHLLGPKGLDVWIAPGAHQPPPNRLSAAQHLLDASAGTPADRVDEAPCRGVSARPERPLQQATGAAGVAQVGG